MPSRRKYKPKFVAEALSRNYGMVYVTARQIGCSHQMIYNYIEEYDEVREAYEEQSGFMVDVAETQFYAALKRGEPWAINKMLGTKGRSRGYGEHVTQEHTGKETIEIVVTYADQNYSSNGTHAAREAASGRYVNGQTESPESG